MSLIGVAVAVALAIWQDRINIAMFIALAPAAIAVPKYIFGRIESGWGFVSVHRPRAPDATGPGQHAHRQHRLRSDPAHRAAPPAALARSRLDRRHRHRRRIDDDSENGAENVLPVGTHEELRATLGHLAVPLGTADDEAYIEHLLTAPAREIDGFRTQVRPYWIARRTEVTVLLPGALVKRGDC